MPCRHIGAPETTRRCPEKRVWEAALAAPFGSPGLWVSWSRRGVVLTAGYAQNVDYPRLPLDFGLRDATWRERAERWRLRADDPAGRAAAPAAGGRQSDVPAAGSAIGDHRPRRRLWRSGQGRPNPPLPGCRHQAAGRTRPRDVTGQ